MPGKETVVLVHGTFAAPRDAPQWYQPDPNDSDTFCSRLDAALAARGSPARCWSHVKDGEAIYSWTGQNHWTDRLESSNAFASYLAKLEQAGWTCHVIAHSHGGNVVMDALPTIGRETRAPGGIRGTVTTLGTPFLSVLNRFVTPRWILDWTFTFVLAASVMGFAAFALYIAVELPDLLDWGYFTGSMKSGRPFTDFFHTTKTREFVQWVVFGGVLGILGLVASFRWLLLPKHIGFWKRCEERGKFVLCINSRFDEAWQLLHHLRHTSDPLKPSMGMMQFVKEGLARARRRRIMVGRLQGFLSRRPLNSASKVVLGVAGVGALAIICGVMPMLYWEYQMQDPNARVMGFYAEFPPAYCQSKAATIAPDVCDLKENPAYKASPPSEISKDFSAWMQTSDARELFDRFKIVTSPFYGLLMVGGQLFILAIVSVMAGALVGGRPFYTRAMRPVTWLIYGPLQSLFRAPGLMMNYYVRSRAWKLVQQMAFGLDGFRFVLPEPERTPSWVPAAIVFYEDFNESGTQRALTERETWFVQHFGDLSETLSKLVLTASDMSFLQKMIEDDARLVHGAYYHDEATINRIADWIAGQTSMESA